MKNAQSGVYCGFWGVGKYSISQDWVSAGGKSLRFVSHDHVGDSQPLRRHDLMGGCHCWSPPMRPKSPIPSATNDLFRHRLSNILDQRPALLRLAGLIEWSRFEQEYGALYAEQGRPGLPTPLMVGLHFFKHIKALSDEQVCTQWVENPYLQAFCGETYFQHELPLERSSMSRWRERIGTNWHRDYGNCRPSAVQITSAPDVIVARHRR